MKTQTITARPSLGIDRRRSCTLRQRHRYFTTTIVAAHHHRPSSSPPPLSPLLQDTTTTTTTTTLLKQIVTTTLATATIFTATPLLPVPSLHPTTVAQAADNAQVGTCVLSKCQGVLAKCLGDVQCVANLVCLQACAGTDNETACQIKCGDRYADNAINAFNACAVSEKKCVPQKVDEGLFPVPPDCALDRTFDLSAFQGRWYITAGLNDLFDTFPCQEHYFATPEGAGKVVYAEINWRIPVAGPDGDFIQRSTMQRFEQQPDNPAVLFNHDNEYLHYEDDWYIIGSKPDEYVFVYYRGQNDAWKGYGGATVYTRASSLPTDLIPELKEQAEAAGLDWNKFIITDNSCPPKPVQKGPLEELQEDIVTAERFVESGVEPKLRSFGKGFTILEQQVEEVVKEVEEGVVGGVVGGVVEEERVLAQELAREAKAAERLVERLKMEAQMELPKWLTGLPMPVKEFIMPVNALSRSMMPK